MTVVIEPRTARQLRHPEKQARPDTPILRKPDWLRVRAPGSPGYAATRVVVREHGLVTVCEEAGCPNIYECWEDREATFLIGGEVCTRRCDFCQIDTGKPAPFDRDEPRRVAESVQAMSLRYSTVTGVARDDLADGGAWLYAETVRAIKKLNPSTGVELLIPDFNGDPDRLHEVFESQPEVLAHNVETVPRIFKRIRPAFSYLRSLGVLTTARDFGLVTKSNLILGLGETPDEVRTALADLHDAGCDIVTITQYLRPSARHHPVERWVTPEEFVEFSDYAIPPAIGEIFDRMRGAGMQPIITHPERNRLLHDRIDEISSWVGDSCLVQVTAQSFLGRFGKTAKNFSNLLMNAGLVHFVASDGHDLNHRPPVLSEAYRYVAKNYGETRAQALFVTNPQATLTGDPVEQFEPEPKQRKWYQFGRSPF